MPALDPAQGLPGAQGARGRGGLNALFKARKPHVFLPLSGFTHMVHGKVATLALYSRIAGFFREHLGVPE